MVDQERAHTRILYLLISILLSIIIHMALMIVAKKIPIEAMSLNDQPKPPESKAIEMLDSVALQEIQPDKKKDPTKISDDAIKDLLKDPNDLAPKDIKAPLPKFNDELPTPDVKLSKDFETVKPEPGSGPKFTAPPSILTQESFEKNRTVIDTSNRAPVKDLNSFVNLNKGNGGPPGLNTNGGSSNKISIPSNIKLPDIPTPNLITKQTNPSDLAPQLSPPKMKDEDGNMVKVNKLDNLINTDLHVWEDSRSGYGYFKLSISANEQSARLKAIPKDVIFLVDTSTSIGELRLEQFVKGIQNGLKHLGPNDRFNIVSFKSKPKPMFKSLVLNTEANRLQAIKQMFKIGSSGSTNILAGLTPYIDSAQKTARPLIVYLISDGLSTSGRKFSNDEFIRVATQSNTSESSICTFCIGGKSNRFIMNYLRYSNKGFLYYTPDKYGADKKLHQYIYSLSSLIVQRISCKVSTSLQPDIYPKELPHLYRHQPLNVYGRYPLNNPKMGVQIYGKNHRNEFEELVLTLEFDKAKKADASLKRLWMEQKIYSMVSKQSFSPTEQRKVEIKKLAKEHGIELLD